MTGSTRSGCTFIDSCGYANQQWHVDGKYNSDEYEDTPLYHPFINDVEGVHTEEADARCRSFMAFLADKLAAGAAVIDIAEFIDTDNGYGHGNKDSQGNRNRRAGTDSGSIGDRGL